MMKLINIEEKIVKDWDINVIDRSNELENQLDSTYKNIIIPTISGLISNINIEKPEIIDFGCGIGYLTYELFINGLDIIGIDFSSKSIEYANNRFKVNIFETDEIVNFCNSTVSTYDIGIANMVFHNVPNLNEMLRGIKKVLNDEGYLIVVIPHPTFWIQKFNFVPYFVKDTEENAEYRINFRIRNCKPHNSHISYFHRTLGTYLNSFIENGFIIQEVVEPRDLYKENPDLLFIKLRKR